VGYRYEVERRDYADFAGGAVLHSAPGFPAFPVRLASEALQRALALLGPAAARPLTLWDPCAGSGYLLTVLGLLHRRRLGRVVASDVDEGALQLAAKNLSLLTADGLAARAAELERLGERFGKPGYAASAGAARRLAARLAGAGGDLPSTVRAASVFEAGELAAVVAGLRPDVVIADVPYGEQTGWRRAGGGDAVLRAGEAVDNSLASLTAGAHPPHPGRGTPDMLRALATVLPAEAVVVVAARGRKVPLGNDQPAAGRFRIGTRALALVRAGQLRPGGRERP
jgi:23S rRNA (guanine2535-N1)-methyltransferase